jgi:hypothetical protein
MWCLVLPFAYCGLDAQSFWLQWLWWCSVLVVVWLAVQALYNYGPWQLIISEKIQIQVRIKYNYCFMIIISWRCRYSSLVL